MTTSLIANSWRRSFGSAMPAGFLMRAAIPERWLRIHSLPESKRYPQFNSEREELVLRHNSVATFTLGEGSACTLFIARFGESRRWSGDEHLPLGCLLPAHALTGGDPDDPIQFFTLQVTWRQGAFDDLILASAEDQTGPLLFANLSAGTAYAPYDGGADLFFHSPTDVGVAKSKFAKWLSPWENGL